MSKRPVHSCSKAKEAHPVKVLEPARPQYHRVNGQRCRCHAHCGECGGAVSMCKMGRYHHHAA